jgi:hypothetical protein
MRDFVTSLSFQSGALFVAAISGLLAIVWALVPSRLGAWALGVGAPLGVASMLYWLPAMMGEGSSEYGAWAWIFIAPWYAAGLTASMIVIAVVRRARYRRKVAE